MDFRVAQSGLVVLACVLADAITDEKAAAQYRAGSGCRVNIQPARVLPSCAS